MSFLNKNEDFAVSKFRNLSKNDGCNIIRISYTYFLMRYNKRKSSKFVEFEWHNVIINYLDCFYLLEAVKEKLREY